MTKIVVREITPSYCSITVGVNSTGYHAFRADTKGPWKIYLRNTLIGSTPDVDKIKTLVSAYLKDIS